MCFPKPENSNLCQLQKMHNHTRTQIIKALTTIRFFFCSTLTLWTQNLHRFLEAQRPFAAREAEEHQYQSPSLLLLLMPWMLHQSQGGSFGSAMPEGRQGREGEAGRWAGRVHHPEKALSLLQVIQGKSCGSTQDSSPTLFWRHGFSSSANLIQLAYDTRRSAIPVKGNEQMRGES